MEELKNRYFERLNIFKDSKDIYGITKDIVNYRYGELYGLLDSMRMLDIISFEEYLNLINELNKIYNNML